MGMFLICRLSWTRWVFVFVGSLCSCLFKSKFCFIRVSLRSYLSGFCSDLCMLYRKFWINKSSLQLILTSLHVAVLYLLAYTSLLTLFFEQTDFDSEDDANRKILEYFEEGNMEKVRVRPKEQTDKVQKFKARVWLSNNHPLSLQVIPVHENKL